MIQLDIPAILAFLKENGYEAKVQKETNQIVIVFKIKGAEFPFFLRIYDQAELLQCLIFIPGEIKKESLEDTAMLLHFLNQQLDLPGFGYDDTSNIPFYRLVIPCPEKKVNQKLIHRLIESLKQLCDVFAPIILAVATNQATFQQVRKQLAEQTQKPNV